MNRRKAIFGGVAAILAAGRSQAIASDDVGRQAAIGRALEHPDTLAYFAAKRGLLFGGIAERDYTVPGAWGYDAAYSAAVIREFSLLDAVDIGPGASRKNPDRFDFSTGDKEVDFAHLNGKAVSGGGLAVHDGVPPWISSSTDRSAALSELRTIVATTMQHYAGKLVFWIVSNEAIKIGDHNPNGFRNCRWADTIGTDVSAGTDYVTEAFRAARGADPAAKLIYNDFGIEDGDRNSDAKRAAVLALISSLKSRRLIDGLGIQGHLFGPSSSFNPTVFKKFLDDVRALGLDIYVTELDVNDKTAPGDVPIRDSIVADRYSSFLDVVLTQPGLVSITSWGLGDKYSWYNARWFPQYARADGVPQRPDLLDADLQRKPAYFAVRSALQERAT